MALADIVQASELVRIDGKEYRIAPLTIRDFGEFERWVETLPMENVKTQLDGLTEAERMTLLREARVECKVASGSLIGETAQAMMNCVRGAGYLLWLSMRRHQPSLSRADAESLLTMENIMQVRDQVLRMSGVGDENPPMAATSAVAASPPNGPLSSATFLSDTVGIPITSQT